MTDFSLTLVRANALMHRRADVLADFERELVREVHDRVVYAKGAEATASERQVIEDALAAMLSAPVQELTEMGQAA